MNFSDLFGPKDDLRHKSSAFLDAWRWSSYHSDGRKSSNLKGLKSVWIFGVHYAIYNNVSDHYESQLKSYDPAQWTEIQQTYSKELSELRHKLGDIKTSESKFSKAYSVLDIMIIKLDLDIIPEMQKKLDGTGGDPTQFMSEFEAVKEVFNLG